MTTAADVTQAIRSCLEVSLRTSGPIVDDETDLRRAGLVDSLGFMRLLGELERRLGQAIDLSALDPERLTHVGSLARHIASQHR